MSRAEELRDMSTSERKIVPFNELPTWLQELWDLDASLARRAENHYLELVELIPKKEKEGKPSFWFMRDNHTFTKPEGETLEEIKENFVEIAKKNPYGMICQVTVKAGEIERCIGNNVPVNGKGEVDIEAWYNSVKDDKIFKDEK